MSDISRFVITDNKPDSVFKKKKETKGCSTVVASSQEFYEAEKNVSKDEYKIRDKR